MLSFFCFLILLFPICFFRHLTFKLALIINVLQVIIKIKNLPLWDKYQNELVFLHDIVIFAFILTFTYRGIVTL